jgi:hypothetical protein
MKKYTEFISEGVMEVDEGIIKGLVKLKIDEYEAPENEKLADYSYFLVLLDKLAGRSYALIEACIPDEKQQKAFKQSLRGIIDEQRDKVYRELVQGQ